MAALVPGQQGFSGATDVTTTPQVFYNPAASGALPMTAMGVYNTGTGNLFIYFVGPSGPDGSQTTGVGTFIPPGASSGVFPFLPFKSGINQMTKLYACTDTGTTGIAWGPIGV